MDKQKLTMGDLMVAFDALMFIMQFSNMSTGGARYERKTYIEVANKIMEVARNMEINTESIDED